jgi:hypothetical protein
MSMLQMSSTWVMGESSVRARDSATLASLVNGERWNSRLLKKLSNDYLALI